MVPHKHKPVTMRGENCPYSPKHNPTTNHKQSQSKLLPLATVEWIYSDRLAVVCEEQPEEQYKGGICSTLHFMIPKGEKLKDLNDSR